jgi:hypothetical protein
VKACWCGKVEIEQAMVLKAGIEQWMMWEGWNRLDSLYVKIEQN